jgi:hypothetical protein
MAPETNDLEWPRWPSMPLGTGYEASLSGARFSANADNAPAIQIRRTADASLTVRQRAIGSPSLVDVLVHLLLKRCEKSCLEV